MPARCSIAYRVSRTIPKGVWKCAIDNCSANFIGLTQVVIDILKISLSFSYLHTSPNTGLSNFCVYSIKSLQHMKKQSPSDFPAGLSTACEHAPLRLRGYGCCHQSCTGIPLFNTSCWAPAGASVGGSPSSAW